MARVRNLAGGFIYLGAGLILGAFSAYLAIENAGVERTSADAPWFTRPDALSGAADIYVRAHYMINGRLPPAAGQIIEASLETDKDGQPLTSACSYRLTSTGNLPRWWSIAATSSASPGISRQSTADTDSAIRESNGTVAIVAATTPRPGNWLKPPDARRFSLLYSAQQSPGQDAISPPFAIVREGCP